MQYVTHIVHTFKQRSKTFPGYRPTEMRSKIAVVWYLQTESIVSSYIIDEVELTTLLSTTAKEVLAIQVYLGGSPCRGNGIFEHRQWPQRDGSLKHSTHEYLDDITDVNLALFTSRGRKINVLDQQQTVLSQMALVLSRHIESQYICRVAEMSFTVVFSSSAIPYLVAAREISLENLPSYFLDHRDACIYLEGDVPHLPPFNEMSRLFPHFDPALHNTQPLTARSSGSRPSSATYRGRPQSTGSTQRPRSASAARRNFSEVDERAAEQHANNLHYHQQQQDQLQHEHLHWTQPSSSGGTMPAGGGGDLSRGRRATVSAGGKKMIEGLGAEEQAAVEMLQILDVLGSNGVHNQQHFHMQQPHHHHIHHQSHSHHHTLHPASSVADTNLHHAGSTAHHKGHSKSAQHLPTPSVSNSTPFDDNNHSSDRSSVAQKRPLSASAVNSSSGSGRDQTHKSSQRLHNNTASREGSRRRNNLDGSVQMVSYLDDHDGDIEVGEDVILLDDDRGIDVLTDLEAQKDVEDEDEVGRLVDRAVAQVMHHAPQTQSGLTVRTDSPPHHPTRSSSTQQTFAHFGNSRDIPVSPMLAKIGRASNSFSALASSFSQSVVDSSPHVATGDISLRSPDSPSSKGEETFTIFRNCIAALRLCYGVGMSTYLFLLEMRDFCRVN